MVNNLTIRVIIIKVGMDKCPGNFFPEDNPSSPEIKILRILTLICSIKFYMYTQHRSRHQHYYSKYSKTVQFVLFYERFYYRDSRGRKT